MDMEFRILTELIQDLDHLTHLYPDIPKDQAFGKYSKTSSVTKASTTVDHQYLDVELRLESIKTYNEDGEIAQTLGQLLFKVTFYVISLDNIDKPSDIND